MRVGDLIVLDDRAYQVDKVIYSKKDETLFLLQVKDANNHQRRWLKLVYGQGELLQQIYREAKAQVQLGLAQLPKVYDFAVDEEKFWMLFNCPEGITLREWMAEVELDELERVEAALPICISLCQAVEQLHQNKYFHGDLNPDNIVLEGGGTTPSDLKLADFGLYSLTNHLKVGAQQYWAPERELCDQAEANGLAGPWIDLYSLGLICIELLTGRLPVRYAYRDSMEWIKFERPSEMVAGFPAQLDAPLVKAVAYHKDNRYPSISNLRAALQRAQKLLTGDNQEAPAIDSTTGSFDLRRGPAQAEGSFGILFVLFMLIFIGTILIWDSPHKSADANNALVEQALPASREKVDLAPEPIVVITEIETLPDPKPNPEFELEPILVSEAVLQLESEPEVAWEPELELELELEAEPEPESEFESAETETIHSDSSAAEETNEKLERYQAAVERYQLAIQSGDENPNDQFRLAAAMYGLGVLEEDPALLSGARHAFSTAFQQGADLVACELAFRATELCIAILDGGHGTAAQLARIHNTLMKAKNRVMSREGTVCADWAFLVQLSLAYQHMFSVADVINEVENLNALLTIEQKEFLNQLTASDDCLLPVNEVLHFLSL